MRHRLFKIVGLTAASGVLLISGLASADATTTNSANVSSPSTKTTLSANQQQRVQLIISRGNLEIARRLATLNTLTAKINAATKLSSSDKTTLSNEVSSTTSGLTALKTQLDADTTIAAAHTDAESIFTEYRVYALVAPKVGLIKVADDQQVTQSKLTALSTKLQSRITAEQQAGKDVTQPQSELTDMNSKITSAQSISNKIETSVITLQPTDYNNDHAILSGDNAELKTAHTDDQAAFTDANNIVSSLKSM